MKHEYHEGPDCKPEESSQHTDAFTKALSKIAKADAVSSRAAIQAAQSTKPSRHTRFVHAPEEDQA